MHELENLFKSEEMRAQALFIGFP